MRTTHHVGEMYASVKNDQLLLYKDNYFFDLTCFSSRKRVF